MIEGHQPSDILNFWFKEVGPEKWYARDDDLDRQMTDRFSSLVDAIGKVLTSGQDCDWLNDPIGSLAVVICLDQFPRNIYRGRPEAFIRDHLAIEVTTGAIEKGFDTEMPEGPREFFYLPFMHAENLKAQEVCVGFMRTRSNNPESLRFAIIHRDIIADFGRFPHRNEILGRESTPEEVAFLEAGGFAG